MEKEDKLGRKSKGTFSMYTIYTAFFTGGAFSIIGSLVAAPNIYLDRLILTAFGCFLAHWVLTHAFHDLFHYDDEERKKMSTVSKNRLKILIVVSFIILYSIAGYLTLKAGLLVIIFTIIGTILSMYAKRLLYHEAMYAFAGFFASLGSFYVQTSYFAFDLLTLKSLLVSTFAFFTCYGWIHLYRLDHYGWSAKERNKGLYFTKFGVLFLIIYLLIDKVNYWGW